MTTKIPNSMLEAGGLSGAVLQTRSASTSAASTITTAAGAADAIPQSTQGGQVLTLAITPTSALNYLEIEAIVQVSADTGSAGFILGALFRDSASAAFAANLMNAPLAQYNHQLVVRGRILAGSTAATTFKLRVGMVTSGSVRINTSFAGNQLLGGVAVTALKITEVTP